MNRTSFALFVALLIHVVLFLSFYLLLNSLHVEKKQPKKQENKIKISLKEMPKTKEKSGIVKQKVKKDLAPPMKKVKPHKKVVQKTKPQKKKKTEKKPTKKFEKPKKQTKKYVKPKEEDPLSWLNQDLSEQEQKQTKKRINNANNISQDIRELYGEEFEHLTQGQQKYLLDNQEIMRRITQRVLNRVASTSSALYQLHVKSSNIIEFYLYPNGDISEIKFLSKSGYFELDQTTKETIEYAYSKYPRPTEKTLIRYRVFYDLR